LKANVCLTVKSSTIKEIKDGTLEYNQKGNREYTPVQNLPSEVRNSLFASEGINHDYDIKCAAQSLLLQEARKLGLTKPTPGLDQYVSDTAGVRAELAKATGIDLKTIKLILHAMLFGSKLSSWSESQTFQVVGYDKNLIIALQNHPFIQAYKADLSVMWRAIKQGRGLTERLNGSAKNRIYTELEHTVLKVVKVFLRKKKIGFILIHDGFTTTTQVDLANLEYFIRSRTGYSVNYGYKLLKDTGRHKGELKYV
jgi:hypothetical protein